MLNHFNGNVGVRGVLPARSAGDRNAGTFDVYAQGAVMPGDSGSGIISSDGRAVGVIDHRPASNSIGTSGVDAGTMGVTRLTRRSTVPSRCWAPSSTSRRHP